MKDNNARGEEDDEFTLNLDVLVSNLGKRCRFATPLPAHLRSELRSAGYMDVLPPLSSHTSPLRTTGPGDNAQQQERLRRCDEQLALDANHAVANEECISAIPNVNLWLGRVRKARSQGEAVLADVEVLAHRLNSLCDISRAVKAQSDHLSANASSLMVRKAKLEHVQEALQHHIRKFTKVEDLVREAEHPLLSAASARFPLLLQEMEDTMSFLTENHNLRSAKPYAAKLALAQQRALVCLREAVCVTFQQAQAAIASSAEYIAVFRSPTNIPLLSTSQSGGSSTAARGPVSQVISSEGAEAGGETDKLRALLATLNDSFVKHLDGAPASQRRLVEARCAGVDEDVHLSDILGAYRDARTQLLFPILRDWLDAVQLGRECATLGSFASVVCSFLADIFLEEQALYDTVWLREDVCKLWDTLAREVGEELYHCFRARLLCTDGLDDLSEGVAALQQASQLHHPSMAACPEYATLVKRMVQDTQERIVFRVSVHLRTVIASRRIAAGEPQSILQTLLPPKRLPPQPNGEHGTPTVEGDEPAGEGANNNEQGIVQHPSLAECIRFLNMLYPAVERPVFGVFADECIHMTLTFMSKLVKQIQQQNHTASIAPLLGSLYHLHHLLLLRETVTRFEVTLSSESKNVDLTLLVQRKMEIVQFSREARKDIESDMKSVCEDIMNALVHDIVRSAKASTECSPLEEGRRLTHEADLLMCRFIPSGSTRSVLVRPILARVEEALLSQPPALEQATATNEDGAALTAATPSEAQGVEGTAREATT